MDGEFPMALVLVFGGRPPWVKDIEKSGCFSILSEVNKEDKVPFFPQRSRFRLSSEVCRAGPPSSQLGSPMAQKAW